MSPAERTISYLRTLTFDGYLTSGEVWSLARFLNENEDCRNEWPGNVLAPLLGDAFHDGSLSSEEMSSLATAISEIEEEWLGQAVEGGTAEPAITASLFATRPVMPSISAKITVEGRNEVQHLVDLQEHKCTCPDWAQRESWPAGHPGRCCKHVAFAFARTGKVLEPWFQALVDECFRRGRGTPPSADWRLLEFRAGRPVLVSIDPSEWCHVLAPGPDGYEPFGYNREQKRWSFGVAPAGASQIEWAIQQNLDVEPAS